MPQPKHPFHVLLVGAGLGGLTAAIAIARAGAKVTVLEANPNITELGAGIQIGPNVSRFLIKYGVDLILGDALVECDAVRMRRAADGAIVSFTDIKGAVRRDYGFPWWVVHRHQLLTALAAAAERVGVEIVVDARVTEINYERTPVRAVTEKGAEFAGDLLIGSDGVRSVVRKALFPDIKPRAVARGAAYRAVMPYREVFEKVPEARNVLGNTIDTWMSDGGYVIAYPINAGRDLNLVLSHRCAEPIEEVQEVEVDEIQQFYAGYEPMIRKVVNLVPHSQRWPLLVTGPLETWSSPSKNVVLMGDAAHSMPNHMAQGAATSMEDGVFLGRVISEVVLGILTVEEAVSIYEKTRMPRAWIKQQAGFLMGEVYHLPPAEAAMRDKASAIEVASSDENVTTRVPPPPDYRSWNLWACPDSFMGGYAYDAEGEADNAVCVYLQTHGDIDPVTKVAHRLKNKWRIWQQGS